MLEESLILMVMGMGTVFLFLIIMVFIMMLMEKFMVVLNKFMPEEVEIVTSKTKATGGKMQEVAVAIAAVKAMR